MLVGDRNCFLIVPWWSLEDPCFPFRSPQNDNPCTRPLIAFISDFGELKEEPTNSAVLDASWYVLEAVLVRVEDS